MPPETKRPASLLPAFEKLLKAEGAVVDALTPREGVELMIRYYEEVSFEKRPRGYQDMLLFEFGASFGTLTGHIVRQLYAGGRGTQLDLSWSTPHTKDLEHKNQWSQDDLAGWHEFVDQALPEFERLVEGRDLTVTLNIARF